MSFDFGTKNIGTAIGQDITHTASMLSTIQVKNNIPDWKKISSLIQYWIPKLIIIGYPLNMDGTTQKITKKTIDFSKILYKRHLIHTEFHDERLTTIEAKSILYQTKRYKKINKKNINSLSAVLILESWLNKNKK
ncbi:Holliday junction resolvase RuvX [Buchnera aphidicola]|uniref:Holliday junction resolvase RuvX n=1 Tax=Buchnera aphidicola TaxID=9 RepID=UPI0034640CDC